VCNDFLFYVVGEECLVVNDCLLSWSFIVLLHHELLKKKKRFTSIFLKLFQGK
jgi:hypothetical protein